MLPVTARLTIGLLLCGLTLACNKGETAGGNVDSPNAAGAGAERSPGTGQHGAQLTHHGSLAPSLVAVASVKANEATPCERTCGRIGDCLITDDTVNTFDASRLELECLDLCVHTPDDAAPHTALLGCEQRGSCGELLTCARTSWEPLAAIRQSPSVEGIVAVGDPCKAGCQWLYTCIYTNTPPGQGYVPPEVEAQISSCEAEMCSNDGPVRDMYAQFADCLPDYCTSGRFDQCMMDIY